MRHLKLTKWALFLFMGILLTTSCSEDEDPVEPPVGQEENEAPFQATLFEEELQLPASLNSNTDPKAQQLVGEFEMMTSFTEDYEIMDIPPGAVVSHEPVQPDNGRPSGNTSQPDYTVYTYSSGGTTIVYQFSVQNGYDVFEMFIDVPSDNQGLLRYYEIRQSQDGTNGTMKWFVGQDVPLFMWTYQINADDSIFITMDYYNVAYYEMMLYPDNSGHMEIYNTSTGSNVLNMEFQWNADGSGSWTNHQTGESGSW